MYSNFFWITQAIQNIILGLGIPGLLVGGIILWRNQSIKKIELKLREKELQIEAERTRVLLLEQEHQSLNRQLAELEGVQHIAHGSKT
jgi:hypothetical protein